MFSLEPFTSVVHLADIDPVFEEVGEGAISEGNAAIVFGCFGIAPLRNNASPVEIGDQFAE